MISARNFLDPLSKWFLLLSYCIMVFLLYRYVVVGYGLYFSIGYESGNSVVAVLSVSVFCYFFLSIFGCYSCINSAYKLFSLCFILFICAPALLIGAVSSAKLSPLFVFNVFLVSSILVFFSKLKDVNLTFKQGAGRYFILFPVFVLMVFALYLVFLYEGELNFVSLNEVYEKRAEAKQFTTLFLGYAVGWVSNFAAPILIVFGLHKRNFFYVCLGGVGYFLIYMLAGHKSSLIAMMLIVGVFYFSRKLSFQKILCVTLGALVVIFLIDLASGRAILAPYTFDRMIVAPSVLSLLYFDFFSANEPIYLSHGLLRSFIDNPYGMQPPEIIGSIYFDGDWANVNFLGEGFANFNTMGVILYSLFTVFLVKCYDSVSCHLPLNVRLSIFVPVLLYIMNASPLTLVVTGGLFPLVFVILFGSSYFSRK